MMINKKTKKKDIFDISIFILTNDGDYVNYIEFDTNDYLQYGTLGDRNDCYVMITNDKLNPDYGENNEFLISNRWSNYVDKKSWTHATILNTTNKHILNTRGDDYKIDKILQRNINGRTMTNEIIDEFKQKHLNSKHKSLDSLIPALTYAYQQVDRRYDGRLYHGFLGSVGQMFYLSENISDINIAMSKIGGKEFEVTYKETTYGRMKSQWWTSSLVYDYNKYIKVLYFHDGLETFGSIENAPMSKQRWVLPLFSV